MNDKMFQNIVFELTDGRLIQATVPAFCHVGDHVSVKEIRVTNPEKLPKNCAFENLVDAESPCDCSWDYVSGVSPNYFCGKCGKPMHG